MMKNSVLYPITNRYRMALSLDGMWQFQFDPRSCGLAENWKNGLPSPISMPVPASFSDFFTSGPDRDYCGDFWYQKDFFCAGNGAEQGAASFWKHYPPCNCVLQRC